MKIVFMGTPHFAVPSLEKLLRRGHDIAAVVTQPDKPKGRGLKVERPPVKVVAVERGLPVLQPLRVREQKFIQQIREIAPEAICLVSYGQFIPEELLAMPKHGSINVHPSLLPCYRGAAPINWAIINGEQVTGITTMRMSKEMDAGDIFLQEKVPIEPHDTARTLCEKMAPLAAELLVRTLDRVREGSLSPTPQEHSLATFAPKLTREMAKIDWSKGNIEVHNLVRGMDPWPGAYTYHKGHMLKIWKTEPIDEGSHPEPGAIIDINREGLLVQTGKGRLYIKEVQLENRRQMPISEFIRGYSLQIGDHFASK